MTPSTVPASSRAVRASRLLTPTERSATVQAVSRELQVLERELLHSVGLTVSGMSFDDADQDQDVGLPTNRFAAPSDHNSDRSEVHVPDARLRRRMKWITKHPDSAPVNDHEWDVDRDRIPRALNVQVEDKVEPTAEETSVEMKPRVRSVRGVSWSEVTTVPKRKSHRGLDLDLSLNSEVNIRKGWKENGGTK